ncbi:MAG TPA: trypsin-like peptidase domain-containing protein [Phycisphaerae bacterium]|nr:trypsin-like peptidase domain-containing protein [Phycisphaerae bacterium]
MRMHLRLMVVALAVAFAAGGGGGTTVHADVPAVGRGGGGGGGGGDENLRITNEVRVYRMTKDAVVNISSTHIVTARVPTGDPVFDRFFGGQVGEVKAQSLGSGFVIHPSGYIVTNEHVVDEATDVKVTFSSGETLTADVIATDNEHDLAVLKVNPKKPLQAIALGTSEDLMIGEPVYAIGNPFGYAGTMTRGIVSAVDRTLDISDTRSYKGLIQTDASINPGNSGGPLINAYGQVVGINTAIRADAHGIGFAIAVSNMRDLLPTFLNPEATNRAQIGFTVEEKRTATPPATVRAAVMVKSVRPDGIAAKAGLRVGDQILKIGDVPVGNVVDALVALAGAKPGEMLPIEVARGDVGGKLEQVSLAVTKAPPTPPNQLLLTKLGVEAETVTPAVVRKYHLIPGIRGVLLTAVKEDSAAGVAGLQSGDVINQIGRYRVTSVEELEVLLKGVKEDVDATVGIIRGNSRGHGLIHIAG